MPKKKKAHAKPKYRLSPQEQDRKAVHAALVRATKRERDIQRLTKAFQREMRKSNDATRALVLLLAYQSQARMDEQKAELVKRE